MKYLLDTDTCIYWLKGRIPIKNRLCTVGFNQVCICQITVSELYFGAYNSNQIDNNLKTLDDFLKSISVLSFTNDSLKKFGELKAFLRKTGNTIDNFDLLIASVALTNNLILVTNNTRHYQRILNIRLDNWV
ncbi:MAG: PIN domain-containing protein [Cyanobacterium sp. T60_A2020_053]|nr:PIN domain-containing protein [Cyanobacterium sp. T60_A2020_053]